MPANRRRRSGAQGKAATNGTDNKLLAGAALHDALRQQGSDLLHQGAVEFGGGAGGGVGPLHGLAVAGQVCGNGGPTCPVETRGGLQSIMLVDYGRPLEDESACARRSLAAPNRKTDVPSMGLVPAMYSCQLDAPSPSGSALAAESGFETEPKFKRRQLSENAVVPT